MFDKEKLLTVVNMSYSFAHPQFLDAKLGGKNVLCGGLCMACYTGLQKNC